MKLQDMYLYGNSREEILTLARDKGRAAFGHDHFTLTIKDDTLRDNMMKNYTGKGGGATFEGYGKEFSATVIVTEQEEEMPRKYTEQEIAVALKRLGYGALHAADIFGNIQLHEAAARGGWKPGSRKSTSSTATTVTVADIEAAAARRFDASEDELTLALRNLPIRGYDKGAAGMRNLAHDIVKHIQRQRETPEYYSFGKVYRDASDLLYKRTLSGWLRFGTSRDVAYSEPRRPLELVEGAG